MNTPLDDPPVVVVDAGPHVRHDAKVVAVTRLGADRVRTAGREATPLLVRLATGEDLLARAVINASRTWDSPDVLGASGIPAHGEAQTRSRIERALPDVLGAGRARFAGVRTLVVGSGHSAATTLIDLATLSVEVPGTSVVWAIRSDIPTRAYGGEDADALPARGTLGTILGSTLAMAPLIDPPARDVQLDLPQTGVCTSNPVLSVPAEQSGSCCG